MAPQCLVETLINQYNFSAHRHNFSRRDFRRRRRPSGFRFRRLGFRQGKSTGMLWNSVRSKFGPEQSQANLSSHVCEAAEVNFAINTLFGTPGGTIIKFVEVRWRSFKPSLRKALRLSM
ncbi:hypothetical protein EJB05_44578 [Eragrostis curvula]|uniref:Uncharacterized protein n=1 Tax=Eragrostis curvula TaxID=38414 RepID=A0A5J9TIK0_9POAL|nr:hypothetical protein EJB05_44578 [Eragrostis curvula]